MSTLEVVDESVLEDVITVRSLIADAYAQCDEPTFEDIFEHVRGRLLRMTRQSMFDTVRNLVVGEILAQQRSTVLRAERARDQLAAQARQTAVLDTERGVPVLPANVWRPVWRETVHVPGRGLVPWAELTVADHQARIDLLSKNVRALTDDIRRHEEAIATIRAAGVNTLGEVSS